MSAKIITLCFWNRPEYGRRTIHSLSRCYGIEDYTLLIHCDGRGQPHVPMGEFPFRMELVLEKDHLGCNANTKKALEHGFSLSDYVIHVEEDVNLAPDALRYFEWARHFQADPEVMTVAAWRHDSGWMPKDGPFPLGERIETKALKWFCFHCWGWATWKDRWEDIRANWTTGDDQTLSWDVAVNNLRHLNDQCEIAPLVSRANNIGDGGIHRGHSLLDWWAGSEGFIAPETYQLV